MTKMDNSRISLMNPGTGIGAFPERLGSPGTAKIPHIAAVRSGNPGANTYRIQPSLWFHPQIPIHINAAISSIKRIARLNGCDPKIFSVY